jgi:hypothetical protein
MANQQYYLIKIGSIYLTENGLVGGTRYVSEIEGIANLASTYDEIKFVDFRKNVSYQLTQVDQKNKTIVINLLGAPFAVVSDLIDARNAQKSSQTVIALELTHPYDSDFNFTVDVNFDSIEWGPQNSRTTFRDVRLTFTTFEET